MASSKRVGQNRTGKGTRKLRKRLLQTRNRFPSSISSCAKDHLICRSKVESTRPVIKRFAWWLFNKFPNPQRILSSIARIIPFPELVEFGRTRKELQETRRELECVKQRIDELKTKVEEIKKNSVVQSVPQIPCAIPPPPPPPALLPPMARVKATILQTPKKPKQQKEKPSVPCIMRDDILKVKLRRVDRINRKDDEKENKEPSMMPQITVCDLSSVTLKPSQKNSSSNETLENNPPQSLMLKKVLRETAMKRSPGGTPMVTRSSNCTTGSGPTPEFTRALQRKFRSLRVSPLAVLENSQSPTFQT